MVNILDKPTRPELFFNTPNDKLKGGNWKVVAQPDNTPKKPVEWDNKIKSIEGEIANSAFNMERSKEVTFELIQAEYDKSINTPDPKDIEGIEKKHQREEWLLDVHGHLLEDNIGPAIDFLKERQKEASTWSGSHASEKERNRFARLTEQYGFMIKALETDFKNQSQYGGE